MQWVDAQYYCRRYGSYFYYHVISFLSNFVLLMYPRSRSDLAHARNSRDLNKVIESKRDATPLQLLTNKRDSTCFPCIVYDYYFNMAIVIFKYFQAKMTHDLYFTTKMFEHKKSSDLTIR